MTSGDNRLPIEIIEQIAFDLDNSDKLQCLLVCKAWYAYLYRVLVHSIVIKQRRQLTQFLQVVVRYGNAVGSYVREIYLKNHVGITLQEMILLGKYCPYIEIFKFRSWRHYKIPALYDFKRLKQIPRIYDIAKGQSALLETRNTLTHLELTERMVRDLVLQKWLLPFLSLGTNLTHLSLHGYYTPTGREAEGLKFNYFTWDLMHKLCKHLKSIKIQTVALVATEKDIKTMQVALDKDIVQVVPQLHTLILSSFDLDHPVWLTWFSKMYPNLTTLNFNFSMGAFVSYADDVEKLDPEECIEAFSNIAYDQTHLHTLQLSNLKGTHFPGEEFFDMLNRNKVRLRELYLSYDTGFDSNVWIQEGFSMPVLQSIVRGQRNHVRKLTLDMWLRSHNTFREFLQPLSTCSHLVDLTLTSDDISNFNYNAIPLDLILDHCTQLHKLDLARTALDIDNKHTASKRHPLKKLIIDVSRISEPLFRYLTQRCPGIVHMELGACSWMPREIEMKIDMPNNRFEFLRIADLNKLFVAGPEGNLVHGNTVNLFAVTQLDKVKKQQERYKRKQPDCTTPSQSELTDYYHLYENPDTILRFPPSTVRKLRKPEVSSFQYLSKFYQENYVAGRRVLNGYNVDRYLPKKEWRDDVQFGHVSIICKSVFTLKYNYNIVHWDKINI